MHSASVRSFRRPWIPIPVERSPSRLLRSVRGGMVILGILSFGAVTLVPDAHLREGIDAIAGWLPDGAENVVASDEQEK